MNEVIVLREGHARRTGPSWRASSTVTLIKGPRKRVIVDPGSAPGLEAILEKALVWPEEVHTVFLTHGHIDHTFNHGMFKEAVLMDGRYIFEDDLIRPHDGHVPGTDIKVVPTPGHTPDHASLMVRSKDANYLVAGDLFWWEDISTPPSDAADLLGLKDEFAYDLGFLKASRQAVLPVADIVIPGHGSQVRLVRGQ